MHKCLLDVLLFTLLEAADQNSKAKVFLLPPAAQGNYPCKRPLLPKSDVLGWQTPAEQRLLCCCTRHESLTPFHRISCRICQTFLKGLPHEQWFVEALTNFNAVIWVFTEEQEIPSSEKSQRVSLNIVSILTDLWIISLAMLMYSDCIFLICTN